MLFTFYINFVPFSDFVISVGIVLLCLFRYSPCGQWSRTYVWCGIWQTVPWWSSSQLLRQSWLSTAQTCHIESISWPTRRTVEDC